MRLNGPSNGEVCISLAELIRQDETLDLAQRRNVKTVNSWKDDSHWRYPGTSSAWVQHQIVIYYTNWDDEYESYTFSGTEKELFDRLAELVENYGK